MAIRKFKPSNPPLFHLPAVPWPLAPVGAWELPGIASNSEHNANCPTERNRIPWEVFCSAWISGVHDSRHGIFQHLFQKITEIPKFFDCYANPETKKHGF